MPNLPNSHRASKPQFVVVMESAEYGREIFPRDTLREAMTTIKELYLAAAIVGDGAERVIGLEGPGPWLTALRS